MPKLNVFVIFCSFAAVLGSFQYGYHIGELNTPRNVMSCKSKDENSVRDRYSLPPCIPMNTYQFSLVTSIFMLGGLLGSIMASRVADSKGRRWALLMNNVFLGLGPLIMGFSHSITELIIGRIFVGIGCGVTTVVVPMYLAEISPVEYRGAIGVMNQLGIVTGILFSQVQGLYLSTIPGWRLILLCGSVLSLVQIIFLGFSVESPRYLASRLGGYNLAKQALQRLRGNTDVESELGGWRRVAPEEGLEGLISENHEQQLQDNENENDIDIEIRNSPSVVFHAHNQDDFTIWKFITDPHYRPALKVMFIVQLTQQLSGVNAVIFYSTSILSPIFPHYSDLITVFISIVNTFMTIISAYLMDKSGRRSLLLFSIGSMGLSSTLLAISMTNNYAFLSTVSIIGFIATFAIGLGPIPFLIIPEIVDTQAVATVLSLGLAINWLSSFLVGFLFLSLDKILGGNTFYLFSIYLAGAFIATKRLVPETKAKTVEEVWSGWTGKVLY